MRKFLIFVLLSIFLISINTQAKSDQIMFISDEQFSNWMTYYYLSPTPDSIYQAIKYFCNSKLYNDRLTLSFMSFFVGALRDKDAFLKEIYDKMNQNSTVKEKIFFLDILWLINNDVSKKLIEEANVRWSDESVQDKIERQNRSRPYDILTMPIISPQALDMLWATFFATGDEKVVQRIISVIHLSKDGKGQEILIGGAALWSLKSNAKQHKKVMDICRQEIGKQMGLTKSLLQEIVI